MPDQGRSSLQRLLAPRSMAVVGGRVAEVVVRQSRAIGYDGEIWPVHPSRTSLAGVPCYRDLDELPGVPDAAFLAVPREQTVATVARLARLGTGGAVCHASGFAEAGEHGAALQRELVEAAGDMALVGPNCLGFLNYLDGAALWSEQHGGCRVERGVAVIAQSGNIAETLTMQRRSLPLAQLFTIGNSAVTGVVELVAELLEDPRITAIGLCLEELPDVAALSRLAVDALRRQVPLVVLKLGSSDLGARVTLSHTSSLAGSDVLSDAFFRRFGIARVHRAEAFLETLKLLHVHGALPGDRVTSASCSGGEAAMVADLAAARGVRLPELDPRTAARLGDVLGDRVAVRNPLDYHTYVWGDLEALGECFGALLGEDADCHLLVLDLPRGDRCDASEFATTVAAFESAQRATGARACVVSSLPEGLPESLGEKLMAGGIAPMQGLADCLEAVAAAARIGAAQAAADDITPLDEVRPRRPAGPVEQLDEPSAKEALAEVGVRVPRGVVTGPGEAAAAARRLGFPVVVKVVAEGLAHKSDVGGVRVGLTSSADVDVAVRDMASVGDRFLVEEMVGGTLLELIVGVHRDEQFGLALTIGAGGVLAELVGDTVTLLMPATGEDVRAALRSLRIWPLLAGYRGPGADVDAVVAAVEAVLAYAGAHADRLVEVEVNPLVVRTDGAVAVDALVRW
jgi:acyl-CoA synthetase (NDP forming)